MKKAKLRLLSLALAAAVLFSCGITAYAETLRGMCEKLHLPKTYDISVPADIEVRKSSDSEYSDGPIIVKTRTESALPTFDFKAYVDMSVVRTKFKKIVTLARLAAAGDATILSEIDAAPVRGGFTVSVQYPATITLPDAVVSGNSMAGFNTEASVLYKEVSRSNSKGANWSTLSIDIAVKSPDNTKDYVTLKDLEDNLETYLCDLTLSCNDVTVSKFGTYKFFGDFKGTTTLGADDAGENAISEIKYNSVQMGNGHDTENGLSATVSAVKKTSSSGSSSGGTVVGPSKKDITLAFDVAGSTTVIEPITSENGKITLDLSTISSPAKEGYVFDGWYYDKECTKKAEGTIEVTKDTVLYAKWKNAVTPSEFTTEHKAYITGYPDGTVRPSNEITREEIAAILFRLLNDEKRKEIYSEENSFSDMENDRWSSVAVSTMVRGGYIKGYEDGTFRPSNPITRAELATIISKFVNPETNNSYDFRDTDGHWAELYIGAAVNSGLLSGYEDGTFRPDNRITRAEAVTIINRMLVRAVDKDGILKDCKQFPDNTVSGWYYYAILEAANTHKYERAAGEINETWTELAKAAN